MNESREALEKRRDEILAQIENGGRDPEEQAIEVEQQQVSITMIENLRCELADVENRLAGLDS